MQETSYNFSRSGIGFKIESQLILFTDFDSKTE
jgi:hypothetical protein